jgi:hypothetical protein
MVKLLSDFHAENGGHIICVERYIFLYFKSYGTQWAKCYRRLSQARSRNIVVIARNAMPCPPGGQTGVEMYYETSIPGAFATTSISSVCRATTLIARSFLVSRWVGEA